MEETKYDMDELHQRIRRQFNKVERILKNKQDGSQNPLTSDYESAFVTKRREVLEKYVPVIMEKTEGITEDIPDIYSKENMFIFANSLPYLSYVNLQNNFDIVFASAIWVADVLKDCNLIEEANRCMPDYRDIDTEKLSEPFFTDCTHSGQTLKTIAYILGQRNKDCSGYRKKKRIDRVLADEITARNNHHQDVPSRLYFDGLMQLLPKEKTEEAIAHFEMHFWKCVEMFFQGLNVYVEKMRMYYDRIFELKREMEAYEKKYDVSFKDLQIDQEKLKKELPFLQQEGNYIRGFMVRGGQNKEMDCRHADKYMAFVHRSEVLAKEGQTVCDEMVDFISHAVSFACENEDDLKELYDQTLIDIMTQLVIEDPYELCFAFLYMIDQGNELVWLYYPCYMMMQIAGSKLPWKAKKSTGQKDGMCVQDEMKRNTVEEINTAQILYSLTGITGPRDISRFDTYRKKLDQYNLTAEQKNFLFGMIVMGAEKLNEPKNIHFQISLEDFFGSSEEKEDKEKGSVISTKEMESLKREIVSLRDSLYRSEKEANELHKKLIDLQQETKNERQELADLRELVFIQDNGYEPKANMTIPFPYEVKKKTVVFGGHDAWLKQMKELLAGNIRFIVDLKVPADVIRNADIVWLQTDCISHNKYYWVIDTCKKNDTSFRIFPSRYFRSCAEKVYEFDRK
ncbi:MAG: hypothetical protein IKR11_00495 [Solobacterium sp.]|nr:hypothetical protein [Solobacterium sp.]